LQEFTAEMDEFGRRVLVGVRAVELRPTFGIGGRLFDSTLAAVECPVGEEFVHMHSGYVSSLLL
jgi:hypothetical protein